MIATLGSKEGFANLAQALTAPGDVIICPEPGLSDPRLRLHHGRRGDPPRAGAVARGVPVGHQPGGAATPRRRRAC